MKLKNIFAKRMTVAEGVRIPVPRHFYYSTFGVRGRYENIMRTGNYICEGTPGTGFFARNTESHSYKRFVNACKDRLKQSPLTLLLGKEPNFDKENKRVNEAIERCSDDEIHRILVAYQNVIALAKEEELLQRVVRGIKDKMGGHPNKMYVSILSHYKSSIATLEHDVRNTQLNILNDLPESRLPDWEALIDAFQKLVDARRIWAVTTDGVDQSYEQVFFDMGIFDYYQSPYDTPLIRTNAKSPIKYYLFPKGIVCARSSVDFDFIPWSRLTVKFNVVDISTLAVRPQFNSRHNKKHHSHNDALSNLYGTSREQVVGEILFPEINLRYFVNHTGPADDFVKAVDKFKN